MNRVVAVVLNYRNPRETIECVASLAPIDRPLDVVVLDNDSGDGSLDAIAVGLESAMAGVPGAPRVLRVEDGTREAPWPADGARTILLVQTGRNGGYAFGNNVGMSMALQSPATAFVWVLNNDTLVPGVETLDALLARMDEDPDIGICGATVAYADRPDMVQTLGGGRFDRRFGRCSPIGKDTDRRALVDRNAVEAQLAYVNGAAAFVRRAFIEDVGLMTEAYFLYYEEIEWARRAGRWRLAYAPAALVLHQVGASIGTSDSGANSPLASYYLTRNRIRFLAGHEPLSLPVAMVDMVREVYREWRAGRPKNAVTIARAIIGLSFQR